MMLGKSSTLGDITHNRELVVVVITNTIPLVGVGLLGWNISALVVLYWLELAAIFLFAIVRALFAGRRSEFEDAELIIGALANRRASLSIPRTEVAIHLSSIPVVLIGVPLLAAVWLVVGAVTVGVVGVDRLGEATYGMITLAWFGILLNEAATTAIGYLYRGEYKNHSAQTALRGPFIRGALLFVSGLGIVMAVATGSDSIASDVPISKLDPTLVGTPVLIGLVVVKFGFDIAGVYRDHLIAWDKSTDIMFGWAYEPPTADTVETTLTGESTCIRPDWWGRLCGGLSNITRHPGVLKISVVIWLVAVLFAFGGVWTITAGLAIAGVGIPLLLASIDNWLRYGAVEYQTNGDAIVAYDRLFGQALWRIEPWDETALRVDRDMVDDLFGTHTVVVTLVDDSVIRIPRVSDPEPLLAVFDRQAKGISK